MPLVSKKLGLFKCKDLHCNCVNNCPLYLLDSDLMDSFGRGLSCYKLSEDFTLFEILERLPFFLSHKGERLLYDALNAILCDTIIEIEVKENAASTKE